MIMIFIKQPPNSWTSFSSSSNLMKRKYDLDPQKHARGQRPATTADAKPRRRTDIQAGALPAPAEKHLPFPVSTTDLTLNQWHHNRLSRSQASLVPNAPKLARLHRKTTNYYDVRHDVSFLSMLQWNITYWLNVRGTLGQHALRWKLYAYRLSWI